MTPEPIKHSLLRQSPTLPFLRAGYETFELRLAMKPVSLSSQEEFAHVIGFHRTYVGGLERGERNLTLKNVEKIAAKLNIEPLSLLIPPHTG